jgi:hypothetical protein
MPFTRTAAVAALALLTQAAPAAAVEGGLGAYLLGSRFSLAGVVPPPGFYVTNDFVTFQGSVTDVAIGGIPVQSADVTSYIYKLSLTQSFDTVLWGGTPAINVNIPVATARLDFTGPFGSGIDDDETGLGDVAITPIVGWQKGNLHWLVAATLFAPTGKYDTTTVDLAEREIDALSIGKNVWGLQPVVAATRLNPETGHELSGAASVVFSTKNDATDYQTAPQLNVEVAALQHLPDR